MIFDCFNRVAILHIDVAVVLPEEILAVRHDICISVLHSLTLSERHSKNNSEKRGLSGAFTTPLGRHYAGYRSKGFCPVNTTTTEDFNLGSIKLDFIVRSLQKNG